MVCLPNDTLQIYRNNITAVLTGALQAIYPTIQKLVGEDFFVILLIAMHCCTTDLLPATYIILEIIFLTLLCNFSCSRLVTLFT